MSKRWPGLLLFLILLGGGRVAHAAFAASPTTVEFPSTAAGTMSNAATSTLTNDTTVNASLTLAAGCEFTTSTATLSIGSGGATASFKFTPATAGDKTCVVTVNNTDAGTILGTISLHGVATGLPKLMLSTNALAFNNVGVGETSGTMHVTATNNGTDVLHITSAGIVTAAANYNVSGAGGTQTIAVGDHADWDIACKPTTQGNVNDTFRIASDASGAPNSDVALTCNGQQGVLAVDVTSLDFGSVALNGAVTKNVTLSNTGNIPVTGITGVLDNTTVGYSIVAGTVPTSLDAGKNMTVMIKFAPTTPTDGVTSHVTFSGTWTVGSTHTTTAAVTLTGKTIALSLSVTTIDFGDFRYDSAPQKSFNLTNNGTSDVTVSSIAVTPDAGTTAAELPLTITLDGVAANLANPLPAGHQFVVVVTAKPNNRVGAIGGKVIASSAGVTLAPVVVKGNATAAVIQTTDANFGAVDIQAPHPKLTAVIKNTTMDGAVLDVSAITVMTTQGTAGAFTFTNALPSGVSHLNQGDTINLEATYAPTVQRTAGDADKVVLVATLTGALDGPKTMMITLSGRGIDRDLALPAAAPVFPSTFRNPGDAAPTMPVTIQNTGEATLSVSAIMVSGDPVWSLADASAVDIPGGTSHDFLVKFAPTDIGPAPEGRIMFQTNDTKAVTASIQLDGTAVPRNVQFGPSTNVEPRTIDLGVTGTNIPISLDDALVVANMDPANTFKLHRIVLSDDAPFQVGDAPDDDPLAPLDTKRYGVTFTPTEAGDFQVTATLYLDQDPVPHSQVVLAGHAVYVEAHGGGGCDAGGTRGPGGLVIGLAMLGVIRRRRQAVAA